MPIKSTLSSGSCQRDSIIHCNREQIFRWMRQLIYAACWNDLQNDAHCVKESSHTLIHMNGLYLNKFAVTWHMRSIQKEKLSDIEWWKYFRILNSIPINNICFFILLWFSLVKTGFLCVVVYPWPDYVEHAVLDFSEIWLPLHSCN